MEPPAGINMKRSFWGLYSMIRLGMIGRGMSNSVESSFVGWPHILIKRSASFDIRGFSVCSTTAPIISRTTSTPTKIPTTHIKNLSKPPLNLWPHFGHVLALSATKIAAFTLFHDAPMVLLEPANIQ